LGEISRLGNERKASVTHTKDFFGKKKWLKVILRTKILKSKDLDNSFPNVAKR
jgi:hypothetical protein